jgi:hypothetical protein
MSTIELSATAATLSATTNQEQGLEFQVRECYDADDVYSRRPNSSPAPANHDDESDESEEEEDSGIRRAMSSAPPKLPAATTTTTTVTDAADTDTDPNIKRVDFKDEATTIRILSFLESRNINTNKLVQEHILKYGSRARVAFNDDGEIVGFALFDNEVSQEILKGVSDTEIKQYMESKPFIFCQLLIVDSATPAANEWNKRLVKSITACIVKNRKIGIVRVDADDEAEIDLYRSCGFYTMADMDVPSYSTSKDNIEVLGFTPLGLQQTAEIFKKFYAQGARF